MWDANTFKKKPKFISVCKFKCWQINVSFTVWFAEFILHAANILNHKTQPVLATPAIYLDCCGKGYFPLGGLWGNI